MVWQLLLKTVLSGILLMVAWSCVTGTVHLWYSKTVLLREFEHVSEGVTSDTSGAAFAKQLNHDLLFLVRLYRHSAPTAKEMSSKDLSKKTLEELYGLLTPIIVDGTPKQRYSILDDLQLETKGLNVTEIIRALERLIIRPNEIVGSITMTDKKVSVLAELKPVVPVRPIPGMVWTIDDEASTGQASFALACKIFRHLDAVTNEEGKAFPKFTDQEFVVFSELRRNLRRYVQVARTETEETRKQLIKSIKEDTMMLDRHKEVYPDFKVVTAILQALEKSSTE